MDEHYRHICIDCMDTRLANSLSPDQIDCPRCGGPMPLFKLTPCSQESCGSEGHVFGGQLHAEPVD